MSTNRIRALVIALGVASIACAPAGRMGEIIEIAEESAIILWDPAMKTQHFIRRASFETDAKDFGFLVPTPSVPELKEAEDRVFDMLDALTSPPMAAPTAAREAPKGLMVAKSEPPKVEVVAKAKVAGYDAAVLKANDAGALDGWLKDNGYHSSPELRDWFKPYIEKQWLITAFKMAAGGSARRVESSAVRMSFQTEQPFFPYREPAAPRGAASPPRLLVVYFLGDARPEGRIGTSGAWPGRTAWSGTIEAGAKASLIRLLKLPEGAAAGSNRLTRFTDGSSPRPGTDDLFFAAAADQSDYRPDRRMPREDESSSMLTWIVASLAAAIAIFFIVRRRKRG